MDTVKRSNVKKTAAVILFLIIITAGIFLVIQYNRFTKVRSIMIEKANSKSIVVKTDEGTIEYAVSGSGDPVLMIHGAGGGYDQGLLLADRFLPKDKMVIAVSRFGYLNTPLAKEPTEDHQAALYKALLDQIGIDKADVVAVSDGGPSALKFAIKYPESEVTYNDVCKKQDSARADHCSVDGFRVDIRQ